MSVHTFLAGCVLVVAAAASCSTGAIAEPGGAADPGRGPSSGPTDGATTDAGGTTPPAGGAAVTGLPCDVANVVVKSCASCHGEPRAGGAPMRLLTYEDLTTASRSDSTRSVAQLAIERMRSTTRPMPPGGGAPASDVAILEAWVAAGTPRGTCSTAAPPPASSAYDTPTVCTSRTRWNGGDDEASPLMHPGMPCIACHGRGEGPVFTAAGTLYPTAHEPDDCNGTGGSSVSVVITDANGTTYTLPVNSAGNFFTSAPYTPPYRAKVISGTKTRAMATPQTDGDCNGCHGEKGRNNAPGRIMAP
jgi:hypothetical protein